MIDIEMGNVLTGDELYLPGDLVGLVTSLELLENGQMAIHTPMGTVFGAMSDMVKLTGWMRS